MQKALSKNVCLILRKNKAVAPFSDRDGRSQSAILKLMKIYHICRLTSNDLFLQIRISPPTAKFEVNAAGI